VRRALARLERARQGVARREARQTAKPGWAPVRNITDPQSRLQPRPGGGWVQGYNAQAVATSDGIVLATSVSNNPSDSPAFVGLMQAACAAAEQMGVGPIGIVLADAGYLSVDNLTAAGPDRLIAVGKRRDLEQAARNNAPSPSGSNESLEIQAMRARLKTRMGSRPIDSVGGSLKPCSATASTTGTSDDSPAAGCNGPKPNGPSTVPCTTSPRSSPSLRPSRPGSAADR
jgi:hypothetical protein